MDEECNECGVNVGKAAITSTFDPAEEHLLHTLNGEILTNSIEIGLMESRAILQLCHIVGGANGSIKGEYHVVLIDE